MIATRSLLVPDALEYATFFQNITLGFDYLFNNYVNYEIGFIFINQLFHRVFGNLYQAFFFIIAFSNFWLVYLGVKKLVGRNKYDKNVVLSMVIYTTYFGIFYSAIVLRQGIVFALMILVLGLLYDKQFIKAIVIALIALLFHKSAFLIFFIILIFMKTPLYSKKTYLFLIIAAAVIYYSKVTVLLGSDAVINFIANLPLGNYTRYLYLLHFNLKNSNWMLFLFASGIFFIIYSSNKHVNSKLMSIFIIGLFILSFFRGMAILHRVTDYFIFFSFILYALSINKIKNDFIKTAAFSFIVLANLYVILNVINHFYL
jgi:hypothetical protein